MLSSNFPCDQENDEKPFENAKRQITVMKISGKPLFEDMGKRNVVSSGDKNDN